MRSYELVLVLNPEMDDQGVSRTLERLGRWIADRGGEVIHQEHWGRRPLAYRIRHFREGNYLLTRFKLAPNYLGDLDRTLRVSEEVIRHLMVRLEEVEEQGGGKDGTAEQDHGHR